MAHFNGSDMRQNKKENELVSIFIGGIISLLLGSAGVGLFLGFIWLGNLILGPIIKAILLP